MIRRDKNGKFEESGAFIIKYQFFSGKKVSKGKLSKSKYNKLLNLQSHNPAKIMTDQDKNRNWWMFQDEFYVENEGLSADQVKAFVLEKIEMK